jgi:transmembrane sensor
MSAALNPDRQRREQAADWCMRLAEGLPALEDQIAFETWLAADTRNRPIFERMAALWEGVPASADAPELIAARTDALEAYRLANRARWSRKLVGGWRSLAAVAACLMLVALGSLYYLQPRPDIYVTAVGERRVLKLDDGSRVSLDAASRIEIAYSDERRALHLLSGRAKFDVAKDPRRPFTVAAGDRVVVATGTAFSVELVNREMRVVLYEGNVAVLEDTPTNQPPRHILLDARRTAADRTLKPGMALVASLDRPRATIETVDPVRSLSWEGGQINFTDEPLGLAVERMNRYSDLKIAVTGPAVQIPVSGAFNAGDTEGFVDGMRALYPLDASRNGNMIMLRDAGAK